MTVRFREEALQDLEEIADYIAPVYKQTHDDLDIIGVFHTSLHPETKRRRLQA